MTVAKCTPGSASGNKEALFRTLTGVPVADDSTTINDTNFPPGAAIMCGGWKSLVVRAAVTGGGTFKVQPLLRMGASWAAIDKSYVLSDGGGWVFDCMGRDVYLRVDTVTGTPSEIKLFVGGFEAYKYDGARRD